MDGVTLGVSLGVSLGVTVGVGVTLGVSLGVTVGVALGVELAAIEGVGDGLAARQLCSCSNTFAPELSNLKDSSVV